jgi:hypothetical protein
VTDSSQPIAGWYPDPENAAAERWWDGAAWSDHRRPSTVPPVAPEPPAAAVPPAAAAPEPGVFAPPSAPVAPAATPTVAPAATPAPASSGYGLPGYGAPAYPAAGPGYAVPAYAPAQPTNTLAVVGLVIALAGLVVNLAGLTALAGAIISCIALARARKLRDAGNPNHRFGMALAGVIAGFAIFVLVLVSTILLFAFVLNNPDFARYS